MRADTSSASALHADRIAAKDPLGGDFEMAVRPQDDHPYFTPDQVDEIRAYYDAQGYVVIRGLLSQGLCEDARERFRSEVRPHNGYIYRQTTANPERHEFSAHGLMLNPILNVQSLDRRHFDGFRTTALEILTHGRTQSVVEAIIGEPGKIVQSMYFDGNPATWPHQDTYYLDAEEIGRMTAGWFAVEEIRPGAGRFFIYPGSHRIDMTRNGGDFDVAFNHARYKKLVVEIIQRHGLTCRAPALGPGDALFWNARTIHGSLDSWQAEFARSSFTAHYIPQSQRFLQYQTRIMRLDLESVNGMQVHRPKDLNRPLARNILWVETNFPKTFQMAKKLAIKALTR